MSDGSVFNYTGTFEAFTATIMANLSTTVNKTSKNSGHDLRKTTTFLVPKFPASTVKSLKQPKSTKLQLRTSPASDLQMSAARLREVRRHDTLEPSLKPAVQEALQLSYEHLAKSSGQSMPTQLLTLWGSFRKQSTLNQYGCYFKHWVTYARAEKKQVLPVCPFTFAAWLAAASLKDSTASPTEQRCAAVAFFSKISSAQDPMDSHIVLMTKESIKRKLGFKNNPKAPLQQDQVDHVVSFLLSQDGLQNLANSFRIALAYEATLRWDDYKDMLFGDFIITSDFVRVFLVDTKTDTYKEGHWSTFAVSQRQTSAYQLLLKVSHGLSNCLSGQTKDKLMEIPVMFNHDAGPINPATVTKVTYHEFLLELKNACSSIGLQSTLFGTHSLRRGSATDQFRHGIPDKVIKLSGRWKSNAFERYIDQAQVLQLQLRALKVRENRVVEMSGLGKLGRTNHRHTTELKISFAGSRIS